MESIIISEGGRSISIKLFVSSVIDSLTMQEAEGSVRYYRKEKSVLSYSDSFGLSATLISCIVASIYISRSLVDQGHSRLKAGTYP